MSSLRCIFKNVFNYRPPQNRHSKQDNTTKKVLFYTSFFNTGWQFFGLHPKKLAKVNEREISIIKDECNTMRVGNGSYLTDYLEIKLKIKQDVRDSDIESE